MAELGGTKSLWSGSDPMSDELARGTVLADRWVILDPLGEGSTGAVYAAWDRELDRQVATVLQAHRQPRAADALRARDPHHRSPAALGHRLGLRELRDLGRQPVLSHGPGHGHDPR